MNSQIITEREYHRQYRLKNKEKVAERKKSCYSAKKQYYLQKQANYRLQNPEIIKTWRAINKQKIKEYNRNYILNRSKIDPVFKIKCSIRKMICKAISRGGYTKNSETEVILGCPFDKFQKYIQDKFLSGMHWNNHGRWHLDHIIPLSSAKTEDELIKLNYFTNLQPLWAKDNLVKGAKILCVI